ncbi:hypothetical protein [Moorena sp. SIO3I6]|uniref:hypothetical protein n=1 Tax=Moorena sp. SIO3I6 TaxID=2607831 RepID=UPI0013FA3E05|nr:hypothetical protein [Moorena sp. SIO3I6]NEP28850.1 hypothetical protein [Moorena sp. SIO3I6]
MTQRTTIQVGVRNRTRYYDLKLGHKTERISMVGATLSGQIIAPMTFVGYCNTNRDRNVGRVFPNARIVTGADSNHG